MSYDPCVREETGMTAVARKLEVRSPLPCRSESMAVNLMYDRSGE